MNRRRPKPQEMERQLGLQYAKTLEGNKGQYAGVGRNSEDINRMLELMSHYNRVAVSMQGKRAAAGAFC